MASTRIAFLILACSAFLQLSLPSSLNQFTVRTISKRNALHIKVSRSSPPLAALEDAKLDLNERERGTIVNLEPVVQKIRVLPGIKISRRDVQVSEPIEAPMAIKIEPKELAMNTRDYSEVPAKREPRIINFKELMNKIRSKSTSTDKESPADLNFTESTYKISGRIDLQNVPQNQGHKIRVFREMNGRMAESTDVSMEEPTFNLKSRLGVGFLVAEMKNAEGAVVGRDEVSLEKMSNRGPSISDVVLKLKLTSTNSARGRASSANGGDYSSSPVAAANVTAGALHSRTDKSGNFEISGLLADSSVVVKTEKPGYFGTVMLGRANQSLPVQLYPQKMVKAFVDLAGTPEAFTIKDFEKYGIVWGRINSTEGQPLSSVRVEITDAEALGPFYFNELYIPDSKLSTTSSNGLFAFLRVKKGVAIVRANQNGKMMPVRIVPVEPNFVSQVELEVTQKQKAQIVTFDAFDKTPLATEIRFAGSVRAARTNASGVTQVGYAKNSDPLIFEIEGSEDYAPVRYHTVRGSDLIEVPLVSHDWLNRMKINSIPDHGHVVGFLGGQRADVFVDVDGQAHQEIYYFNASGEIVPVPVAGGGFVVANLPAGINTISIVPEGSPAIYSQVVVVDSGYLSVLNKKF